LHAIAAAFRRFAIEHPGRYAASVHAPAMPDAEWVAVDTLDSAWSAWGA
jgi:hypothetical protein